MNMTIKNGIIITNKANSRGNIYVKKENITLITEELVQLKAEIIIDASNFLVFPGGIDPHVHMHLPTHAGYSTDDFFSGSKAALFGGTTTLIDFVTPKRGQSIIEALKLRLQEAQSCLVDYKFHISPVEWTNNTEYEINQCVKEFGVKSFKVYMAYKNTIGLEDDMIFKVMKVVGKAGGMITVHAELGDDIESLRNEYAMQGNFSPEYHPKSRPAKTEALAVKKVIELAAKANCPLYIVHVSAKESLDYIRNAQRGGQEVYAETCPHYLLLDDSVYQGGFDKAAPYVLSPPIRTKDDQEALWLAIKEDVIQTIGTDHCPFNLAQKKMGKNDFRNIPNGAGGVEHRLSLLYTYGVLANKISLNQFVKLTSFNSAKIFGLSLKGELKEGAEADIVVWNPDVENLISSKNHMMNCDNNIFEGFKTKGAPEYIIRKGEIVYSREKGWESRLENGEFL